MDIKAAVLLEADYEILEFWYPFLRLAEAGVKADVVAPEKKVYMSKHCYPAVADVLAVEARKNDYDLVVIPGGWAPDKMRRHDEMVDIVKRAAGAGKVIAAICHGGSMLVSARCVKGRRVTSVPAIRDDLTAAGAEWTSDRVVRDGALVTAQGPTDLPHFMREVFAALKG